MKNLGKMANVLTAMLLPGFTMAAEVVSGERAIKYIQVIHSGGFFIQFTEPLKEFCRESGPSTIYIYSGQNNVTEDGVEALRSIALTAFSTRSKISVLYDKDSRFCWGRLIAVTADAAPATGPNPVPSPSPAMPTPRGVTFAVCSDASARGNGVCTCGSAATLSKTESAPGPQGICTTTSGTGTCQAHGANGSNGFIPVPYVGTCCTCQSY